MHLDNSFIFLLSAEESCYFKVAILGFFFALVLSILPEPGLEVKEDPVKVCKNIEKFRIYLASGNSCLQMAQGCLHPIYNSIQKDL